MVSPIADHTSPKVPNDLPAPTANNLLDLFRAESWEMAIRLIEVMPDAEINRHYYGTYTLLQLCVDCVSPQVLRALLQRIDPDLISCCNPEEFSALEVALLTCSPAIVKELAIAVGVAELAHWCQRIARDAEFRRLIRGNDLPLLEALDERLEQLYDHGAERLLLATMAQRCDLAEQLAAQLPETELVASNGRGETPLHIALENQSFTLACTLAHRMRPEDLAARACYGQSCLSFAYDAKRLDIAEILRERMYPDDFRKAAHELLPHVRGEDWEQLLTVPAVKSAIH